MALHTETVARQRLMTYGKNICPQCSSQLLAPDWSEYVNERCVRHAWSCEACAYEFEAAVFFPSSKPPFPPARKSPRFPPLRAC